jgi:hypothetical protein
MLEMVRTLLSSIIFDKNQRLMELQGASTISGMTLTQADLPVISDSGLIDVDSGEKTD